MFSKEGDGSDDVEEEAIRGFVPPSEKLPWTFRLLSVNGLPDWANTSCVSINDVVEVSSLVVFVCSDAFLTKERNFVNETGRRCCCNFIELYG